MGGIGIGLAGSALSAYLSAKEAKKQRKFQERMAKTKYQYTMTDMKKAGLNPILAYKGIGGGTPQGAMGQVPDFGASAARGAEAETKVRAGGPQRKLLKEQLRVAHTQSEANVASAYKAYKEGGRAHSASLLNQQMYWEREPVTDFYKNNPNAALLKEGLGVGGNAAKSFFRMPGMGKRGRFPRSSLRRTPGKLETQWMRRNP